MNGDGCGRADGGVVVDKTGCSAIYTPAACVDSPVTQRDQAQHKENTTEHRITFVN